MSSEKLFTPLKVGAITAANRVFMVPLTRLRSIEPGDIPTPLMAEYYRQRASAGLIISEATQISAQAKGYAGAPGLHSVEQIEAWKKNYRWRSCRTRAHCCSTLAYRSNLSFQPATRQPAPCLRVCDRRWHPYLAAR